MVDVRDACFNQKKDFMIYLQLEYGYIAEKHQGEVPLIMYCYVSFSNCY